MTPHETKYETRAALEAVLMVADRPVDPSLLAQLLEVSAVRVEEMCRDLAAEYASQGRGFTIAKVAGGYRFQSATDQAPYVERFVLEGQSAKLSAAAMETLAIIAYKQPISKAQVAAIRGVNVDGVMRSLMSRGYVDEVGRDAGPGQAVLFGTTTLFLERLGLASADELPPLGSFVPDPDIVEALEQGLRTPEEQAASREAVTKGLDPAEAIAQARSMADAAIAAKIAEVESAIEATATVDAIVSQAQAAEATETANSPSGES
jgi:segregation and condensation protein B